MLFLFIRINNANIAKLIIHKQNYTKKSYFFIFHQRTNISAIPIASSGAIMRVAFSSR